MWVEPTCIEFELDDMTEYKIVTHDKFFHIRFDEEYLTFFLQYSFGFKLFKRPVSEELRNPFDWELEMDTSDIN